MMKDKTLTEPLEFVQGEQKYKYSFEEVTIEPAELCREIAEFKSNQLQNQDGNINDLLRSKGAEWQLMIASYLVRKVDSNEQLVPFNRAKAETDSLKFINSLPASELSKINKMVSDFFYNIGQGSILSIVLPSEKDRKQTRMLKHLATMMTGNQFLTEEKKSQKATKKAN
jgi:hypothetical protein